MTKVLVVLLSALMVQCLYAHSDYQGDTYYFKNLKVSSQMLIVDKYTNIPITGRIQKCYSNGNVEISIEVVDGVRGKVYFYDENGELFDEGIYRSDGEIDYSEADYKRKKQEFLSSNSNLNAGEDVVMDSVGIQLIEIKEFDEADNILADEEICTELGINGIDADFQEVSAE